MGDVTNGCLLCLMSFAFVTPNPLCVQCDTWKCETKELLHQWWTSPQVCVFLGLDQLIMSVNCLMWSGHDTLIYFEINQKYNCCFITLLPVLLNRLFANWCFLLRHPTKLSLRIWSREFLPAGSDMQLGCNGAKPVIVNTLTSVEICQIGCCDRADTDLVWSDCDRHRRRSWGGLSVT